MDLPRDRRPRRARSAFTKAVLLDSARSLFGTRGYRATSVKDITTHADVAVGVFYTYFESKRDPLVFLMGEVLEGMSSIDLRPPPQTNRTRALRAHFQSLFRHDADTFTVVRAWQEAVLEDDHVAAMNAEIVEWSEENIMDVLQHLLTSPNARTERDLPSVASLVNTYMWTLLGRTSAIPRPEFERQIGTIADLLYHYLLRDGRSAPQPRLEEPHEGTLRVEE